MNAPGHNSKVKAGPVHGGRLKSFIHRIEKLAEEIKAIQGDVRDVYSEAKGVGYDVGTMRKVVRLRGMDAADRAEQETLLEVYWHALEQPDRIDARLEAGESQRDVAKAEGVSKSTVQRRGPKTSVETETPEMDRPETGEISNDGGDGEASRDASPATSDCGLAAATPPLGTPEREARAPTIIPPTNGAAEITKDWCLNMAAKEGDAEIGAGFLARDPVDETPPDSLPPENGDPITPANPESRPPEPSAPALDVSPRDVQHAGERDPVITDDQAQQAMLDAAERQHNLLREKGYA